MILFRLFSACIFLCAFILICVHLMEFAQTCPTLYITANAGVVISKSFGSSHQTSAATLSWCGLSFGEGDPLGTVSHCVMNEEQSRLTTIFRETLRNSDDAWPIVATSAIICDACRNIESRCSSLLLPYHRFAINHPRNWCNFIGKTSNGRL